MDYIKILFALFLSHILTDFYLQPSSWVDAKREQKQKSWQLYVHSLLAGVLAFVLVSIVEENWTAYWIIMAVAIPHALIDLWKVNSTQNVKHFLIDQLLHVIHLLVVSLPFASSFTNETSYTTLQQYELYSLIVVTGLLAIWQPTGLIVGNVSHDMEANLNSKDKKKTLPNAGKWIGMLERTFIFGAILLSQWGIIGFLIAAKSILRFSDSRTVENPMRMSEYVLIGTLLSFLIAITISIICKYALQAIY